MKVCTVCKIRKDHSGFHKKRSSSDGLTSCCKDCKNSKNKEWYSNNREKRNASVKEWQKSNRDKFLSYQKKSISNRINERRASARAWNKKNKELRSSREALRRAMKLNATPKWASQKYIDLWYMFAKIESERTGRIVHVDHIIPLKSDIVCGLHCEDNMQLLFLEDNSAKGNRYEP